LLAFSYVLKNYSSLKSLQNTAFAVHAGSLWGTDCSVSGFSVQYLVFQLPIDTNSATSQPGGMFFIQGCLC